MALPYDKPIQAFGAPKPSDLKRMTRQERRRWQRAVRRLSIAKFCAAFEGSLTEKQDAVEAAIKGELIPMGNVPCRETLRTLENRFVAGEITIEDYLDRARSGRPKEFLPAPFEERIQQAIKGGARTNAHQLTKELTKTAKRWGLDPPSYYAVHRRCAEAGRLQRSAARHGSRAAIIDSSAHGRVPTRHTHDGWALDELSFPVYGQRWSRDLNRIQSVLFDLVLIVDIKSTVIVGWHLADASRRVKMDGDVPEQGFDQLDVLAALMNATCPELAPDSTRDFAGYLPNWLRWDSASPHKSLEAWIDESVGLDLQVRRIQRRRPDSNGSVECRVKIAKVASAGIRGHKDYYQPTDRIDNPDKADPGRNRSKMAAKVGAREDRKIPMAPERLPTQADLRALIDRLIYEYNFEHVNSYFAARPVDLYHENMASNTPRRGHEFVRALTPQTTRVTKNSIRHYANGREYQFPAEVDGALLMVDKEVTYYADPLNRGIFVPWNDGLHFLAPDGEPSREKAAKIAMTWAAAARRYSDEAEATREAEFIVDIGQQALHEARTEQAAAAERLRKRDDGPNSPGQNRGHGSLRPTEGQVGNGESANSGDEVDSFDPWKNARPDAFVRRRKDT